MVKILNVGLSLIGCIVGITDAASNAAYIVMASPRPWRLSGSSDDHDPDNVYWRGTWELRNSRIVKQIEGVASEANAPFGLVNGDLTEYGRLEQQKSLIDIYGNMKPRMYFGLGDRDYHDNREKCHIVCPWQMIEYVDGQEDGYEKELPNFRRDRWRPNDVITPGSLAYSWDNSMMLDGQNITSHFVQLHMSPEYDRDFVSVNGKKTIKIRPSFSWLWEDLYLARKRKVDYIFVNLHAKDRYLNSTTDWNKRKYAATLAQFKVDAVFTGEDDHPSMGIAGEGLYPNIPVYKTGALFEGHFAKLQVFKDGFQVTNYHYDLDQDVLTETVGDLQPSKAQPVWCKMEGQAGTTGDLYTPNLILPGRYYNLVSNGTGRALDANSDQEVYTNEFDADNIHQRWLIEPMDTSVPPYETAYRIIHQKTGKALDGNKQGDIYTRDYHGKDWQRWHIHKLNDDYIHWINEATNRSLDGNAAGKVYGSWDPRNFDNTYQMWRLVDPFGWPTRVQYFRARTDDAWNHPFPDRDRPFPPMENDKQPHTQSNDYWEYLGDHRADAAPPCIGW